MLKGDPNKNPIMSRAATSNDVALYAVDKQIIYLIGGVKEKKTWHFNTIDNSLTRKEDMN